MKKKFFSPAASALFLFILCLTWLTFPAFPKAEDAKEPSVEQVLDQWLVLGPAQVPALTAQLLGENQDILNYKHLSIADLNPLEGSTVAWTGKQTLRWTKLTHPQFVSPESGILYLATYIEPTRWLKATLQIHATNLGASVYLDGEDIKEKLEKDKISAPLSFTNEKHLLILKVLLLKGETLNFKASLQYKKPFQQEKVALSLVPNHPMKPENVLNTVSVTQLKVSPNGKRVAVSLHLTEKGTGQNSSWIEILDIDSGRTLFSSQGLTSVRSVKWVDNSTFSFTNTEKGVTSIALYNIDTRKETPVLKNLKNFSSYWWAPDSSYLIYTTYQTTEDNGVYKYIEKIPDRAEDSGTTYSMFIHFMNGSTHQIGDTDSNYEDAVISPDNKKVLLSTSENDNKNRPYVKTLFSLFQVETLSVESLLESNWVNRGQFSYDSKKIVFLGGPTSFDGIGNVLPKDVIPNDYDSQAFIYDLTTRKAEAISRQFDPSITQTSWLSSPNYIYCRVADKSFVRLYKYSINKKTYTPLNTQVDTLRSVDFASQRDVAVYWGSSADAPFKLFKINLANGRSALLKDYNNLMFREVQLGVVKDCNYRNKKGQTVYGRLHYPANFDKTKKYPCIVYYYGGTSPVTRDFGGRYPMNWYAANGYIVYVLQPSGTYGFGQEFSAVHVNDWGKTTAEEIIGATKQLVGAHTYIDKDRLGAMGASYGGFMTMYLATQTDIFAAYISHAGISALSSYWGVGDWGYTYSGVATADSFPWNRKDIYVGHSPLFMADRITSPLLLLHGNIDNNVPPGESYQMFAALKLLNKETALVTYKDTKHWVMDYKKRLHWMRTIIAWWDKQLKKQPEHWEDLFN